jgi:hypothetical protein
MMIAIISNIIKATEDPCSKCEDVFNAVEELEELSLSRKKVPAPKAVNTRNWNNIEGSSSAWASRRKPICTRFTNNVNGWQASGLLHSNKAEQKGIATRG